MAKNEEAPLAEVIFEVRWGRVTNADAGAVQYEFDEEDLTLFAGLFRSAAKANYPYYRKVNESLPVGIPHIVKHQFWTAENRWPCLQAGLGIMTANITNDEYEWDFFKETCIRGLEILNEAHHKGLEGMPAVGVELRYQDAFPLKGDESENDFVKSKAQITFDVPDDFLQSASIEPEISNHHIAFSVPAVKPKGVLVNALDRGLVGGKVGFIQRTIVRSSEALCPDFTRTSLEQWLVEAHVIQQHVYKTLIRPTFERNK